MGTGQRGVVDKYIDVWSNARGVDARIAHVKSQLAPRSRLRGDVCALHLLNNILIHATSV